ncbi:hypothetical protein E4P40_03530 [Blastococcus sp. CT_GayMR20]|uniref:hypothetical protein n=1 Tax=Blastococcus sp. CT_GayMR20 TaxID=2559609 RepID=UPI0010734811|nr:hypothetical protein [Blastococcus sp. CT_GayMR20]TFV92279.1 hypothetical protein E4P40_03530 [Blastococcus sp. CT_GayMR20]
MERESTWQRLDAQRWVHLYGMWQTTLLTVWAGFSLLGAWLAGVLWFVVFPAAITALSGWVTAEWGRGRPWTWYALTVQAGVGILLALGLVASGSVVKGSVGLVLVGGLLLLLWHPDCRARIHESGRPAARL